MECVNLLAHCGTRYRITFDPAYSPRHVPRSMLDSWYMLSPGKFGTIYPTGGDLLRVDIDRHPSFFRKVAAIPGCVLVQDGDHEKTLEFQVDLLDQVASIVKSRRRRVLTPDHRARLQSANRRFQFQRSPSSLSVTFLNTKLATANAGKDASTTHEPSPETGALSGLI